MANAQVHKFINFKNNTFLKILALVLFIYGLIASQSGAGQYFFLAWILAGLLLFLISNFDIKKLILKLPKWQAGLLLFVIVAFLLFLIISTFLIASAFGQKLPDGLDYIVVLGARVYEDGPSPVLKYRLDAALDYLERNPATRCVVTGKKSEIEPFAEAIGMKRYLVEKGVVSERIILEDMAKNTQENIIFSRDLIEDGASIGIITNDFHMFRSMNLARRYGMEKAYFETTDSSRIFLPHNMLRESLGMIKFWFLQNPRLI